MIRSSTIPLALLFSLGTAMALDVVSIRSGKVSGMRTDDGAVISFKGIPFAAPPIGQLRWKEPQPVLPWEGIRESTEFGPSPMQSKPAPFSMWSSEFLIPEEPIDEDCLNLNVWTGATSADERRPVLVWIYGGGFNSGGSACPIYDGEAMARQGIVFVSVNYRVGIFGFFAHPELTKESPHKASGNYGLLDQLAGLRWVQENIASFGGDPSNVTIAGQSAGSMSVNCLVASPLGKGLFQRAIGHSGASFSGNQMSLMDAERAGVERAASLSASSLAELRAMSAEELMRSRGRGGPIIDGHVLPEQIADIFAAGRQNQVDLMTGWTQDEGLMFGPVRTAAEFKENARQRYGDAADMFLGFYPANDDAEAAQAQLDVARDSMFGIQNHAWASSQSARKTTRVFVYRFMRKVPGTGEYAKYGAFHTGDVPYSYGNLKFVDRPWEPVDHRLAATMSGYWSNFVKTGDPNGDGLPSWPAYDPREQQIVLLGDEVTSGPIPDREALEFIRSQQSR